MRMLNRLYSREQRLHRPEVSEVCPCAASVLRCLDRVRIEALGILLSRLPVLACMQANLADKFCGLLFLLLPSCTLPLVRDEYTIVLRLLRGHTRGSRKGLAECFRTWLGHLFC